MTKIDYINAHNGGIQMYAGLDNIVGWGKTVWQQAPFQCYHGSNPFDLSSARGYRHNPNLCGPVYAAPSNGGCN